MNCNGPADMNMIWDITKAAVKMEIMLLLLRRKKTEKSKNTTRKLQEETHTVIRFISVYQLPTQVKDRLL